MICLVEIIQYLFRTKPTKSKTSASLKKQHTLVTKLQLSQSQRLKLYRAIDLAG